MNFRNIKYELRLKEAVHMISKYPGRIPIIVNTKGTLYLRKNKYMVPNTTTCGHFIYILRNYMDLKPEKSIFIFINNMIPISSETIGNLYTKHKDDDLFLYIYVTEENTFG
jgi:GABA(A) receptor-associated protein